jgi:hypothetical protein
MKIRFIRPEYVKHFPRTLDEGVLYVSEEFETAAHLCCCGCGEKVITPLNPAKWQLCKEQGSVTLSPSIGNWNYECKSHYLIVRNQVIAAKKFDGKTIEAVQRRDRRDMDRYIKRSNAAAEELALSEVPAIAPLPEPGLAQMLVTWLRKWLSN